MYKRIVILAIFNVFHVTTTFAASSERNLLVRPVYDFAGRTLAFEANLILAGESGFFGTAVPQPTPVEQVIEDWKKNAISASKKYQSRITRVSFDLHKVALSNKGQPILEAEVKRRPLPDIIQFEFQKPSARDMDYLGGLSAGNRVEAVCAGKIGVLGSPGGPDAPGLAGSILTFKNCKTVISSLEDTYKWFKNALEQWASGEVDESIAKTPRYDALLWVVARSYNATKIIPEKCMKYFSFDKIGSAPGECEQAFNKWQDAPVTDEAKAFMDARKPKIKP